MAKQLQSEWQLGKDPLTREQFISILVNALELDKEYNKNA